MMSNEEYHHLEMENSQYKKSKSSRLLKILVLTKPSDIDNCKSKNEASVSETLALFNRSSEG